MWEQMLMRSFQKRLICLWKFVFPHIIRKTRTNLGTYMTSHPIKFFVPNFSPAYQITYHLNSTNSNTATVDVLSPSARQYTVNNLKPESVYVFRITAQTRKGWGEAAEALVVTTEKRGNPALLNEWCVLIRMLNMWQMITRRSWARTWRKIIISEGVLLSEVVCWSAICSSWANRKHSYVHNSESRRRYVISVMTQVVENCAKLSLHFKLTVQ